MQQQLLERVDKELKQVDSRVAKVVLEAPEPIPVPQTMADWEQLLSPKSKEELQLERQQPTEEWFGNRSSREPQPTLPAARTVWLVDDSPDTSSPPVRAQKKQERMAAERQLMQREMAEKASAGIDV